MSLKKIGIQRVYQIRDFENVRIFFEIEIGSGQNHREIILNAYREILNIERTIAEFEYTKTAFENLKNDITKYSRYRTIFDKRLEDLENIKEEKLKTLGCLEKIDLSKLSELPTACIEEYNIQTLRDLENRKETLKQQIEEIEKVIEANKNLKELWREFENEYNETMSRAEELFIQGHFGDAIRILKEFRDKIKEFKEKIDEADPEKFRYSWR